MLFTNEIENSQQKGQKADKDFSEYIITYQTGESRTTPGIQVDYMASVDEERTLYAEEPINPDRFTEDGTWKPGAEDESRDRLQAEILRQAESAGMDPDMIVFN